MFNLTLIFSSSQRLTTVIYCLCLLLDYKWMLPTKLVLQRRRKLLKKRKGSCISLWTSRVCFLRWLWSVTNVPVSSAGQAGPTSNFLNDTSGPQHKDAETLGTALFNNESFEGWVDLYAINSASIFFVSTAFLGMLAKGSEDVVGFWSSIINITSISGLTKVAQEHVSSAIGIGVTYSLTLVF